MSKTIIFVDDSEIVVELCGGALKEAGYEVTAVTDLNEVPERLIPGADLIIIDVNMPQMYGNDAAWFFREEYGTRGKIYLFSGIPEAELKVHAEECGADGYILKTDDLGGLVHSVDRILA